MIGYPFNGRTGELVESQLFGTRFIFDSLGFCAVVGNY